jgi:hypothetical protein
VTVFPDVAEAPAAFVPRKKLAQESQGECMKSVDIEDTRMTGEPVRPEGGAS